jgi:hypothetical protein
LRVASFFSGAVNKGRVATTLAIEVRRRVGDGERRIDLLIEARPAGPGLSIRDSAELKLGAGNGPAVATRELELTPGLWQARVVVRDPGTERVGSVLHTFEVPGATGLHLSSPLLSDALESEGSPRPRLRLDRGYPSGGALYCLYQVFGATPEPAGGRPRVSAGYEITTAGRTVQEAPPTRIEAAKDGQVLRLLGIGLAGFEPGDYTLTLRVLDEVSGEIRAASEPFTVVRAGG